MKILMYVTYFPPHYSGAAKQGIALAKRLRKRGHIVEFITIRRDEEKFSSEHEGFKVWRINEGRGKHREFCFWWNFLSFLFVRRNAFDILHSHGAYYYNSVVGPLGRLFGIKSIVKTSMAKNDLSGLGKRLSGKLHAIFLKQVDAYVAISKELQDELSGLKFLPEKIHFLPNGVDTERFKPLDEAKATHKRKLLALEPEQLVALSVGVFDSRKNIGWLIDEWVCHEGFQTGALLVAVGPQSRDDPEGLFLNSLRKTAEEYPHLVKVLGHVEDIEVYFQAADFFVLPSTNEGMPNVVLEAMACGLPCVSTAVSGCRDLIKEGYSGFMFPPNNSEKLQHALAKLITCEIAEMGHNARGVVEQNFSLDALAAQYEKLYLTLKPNSNG